MSRTLRSERSTFEESCTTNLREIDRRGISAPADEDFIFIFTGPSDERYGYDDELLPDGTLIYFGKGRIGDMEFTANNGNTKLRD
jgi:hypothetical protein